MMAIQSRAVPLSVQEYLAGEETSDQRHEYLGSWVYAMTGASARHNLIAINLITALRPQLRGTACQLFVADMKLHLTFAGENIFYYPDLMVCCDPDDRAPYYRTRPCLIVEITSDSTERIDRREKLLAYSQIDSLEAYLILSQQAMHATLHRRENDWRSEVFTEPQALLPLPCAELQLSLVDAYEDVSLDETF